MTSPLEPARAPAEKGKKIRLHISGPTKEEISAMASDTLRAGGWVEALRAEPKIGETMPDGTVFAGISPETNKPMYTTSSDVLVADTFNETLKYAANLEAHGHRDWRLPTKDELKVLFNTRSAVGGFNDAGSDPAGWYWSSSSANEWHAWVQRFSDGHHYGRGKDLLAYVRCVR